MASFNKIIIVGYLGRDPELRYTAQGDPVCTFSVATTEKRTEQELTTWFRVTAWRRLAELSAEYLSKGKQVYVEGRVRLNEYTDREGTRRANIEVTATEIHFIGQRPAESDGRNDSAPESAKDLEASDIPF